MRLRAFGAAARWDESKIREAAVPVTLLARVTGCAARNPVIPTNAFPGRAGTASTTPRCAAASVAFQAGAVPDQREIATGAAGITFIAFEACFGGAACSRFTIIQSSNHRRGRIR